MGSEADAVLVGLNAQVDDLADVDQDGAVGGLDLVPAVLALLQRLAQAVGTLGQAQGRAPGRPGTRRRCDVRRWDSMCLHGLDELGQDAARRGGMQERDLRAPDAGTRRLVDQPQPRVARRAAARPRRPPPGRRRGAGRGRGWPGSARRASPRERRTAARRGSRRRRAARPRRPAPRSSRGARAACRRRSRGARSPTRDRDREPDVVDAPEHAQRMYPRARAHRADGQRGLRWGLRPGAARGHDRRGADVEPLRPRDLDAVPARGPSGSRSPAATARSAPSPSSRGASACRWP